MSEEINTIENFSAKNEDAEIVKENLVKLAKYSMFNDKKIQKVAEYSFSKVNIENYDSLNDKVKKGMLTIAAEKSGIEKITNKKELGRAFSNPMFQTVFNSIMVDALDSIVLKSRPEQIMRLATVVDVECGDSYTFTPDTKGLPFAQKTSYTTNVTFLDGYSVSPITIKPQPYSVGITLDYIRILANDFDIGKEIARVAASLLYTQLKLIVESIYAIADVTGTPFYQATFSGNQYTQMISDVKMLNGNSEVTAYGTLPAFYKLGVTSTTNYGFETQDEMIREGYLGRAYGIENVVIDQFTNLAAPFTTASATSLRVVPDDRILLLSSIGDKPVKLVREDFIRVKSKDPMDGSQYRTNYEYFMSFDAAIATQANYGIQGV